MSRDSARKPQGSKDGAAPQGRSIGRLLAEGAAIVVSILLAFAIDAGWDELQDRRKEQVALAGLRADFLANEQQLARVVATHRARAGGFKRFSDALPTDLSDLPQEEAVRLYRELWAPHTFDAVRSSIDALVSAGKLHLLRDRELQERLVAFLNRVDDLHEESARIQSSGAAVLEGTIPHGGPWRNEPGHPGSSSHLPELSPADLASLRQDAQLMGWIGLSHQYSTVYLEELDRLTVLVGEVLKRVEANFR